MTQSGRIAARIAEIAADLSGFAPADINPTSSFLALGFDSLMLTQLAAAIQKEFGVKTTFRNLMEDASSLSALAARLESAAPKVETPTPAPPAKKAAPTPDVTKLAVRPAAPGAMTGVEALFEAQLALMRQQLEILGAQEPASPPLVSAAAPSSSIETKSTFELPKGFGPQLTAPVVALTAAQRAHLDRLIARYNAKTSGSKARTEADRAHFADPRTAAGFNRLWKEMVYPIVVERSFGAHLWDVDGNRYVDLLNGFGPNFFGHRAPFIVDALRAQLDEGYEVGPQTPRAGEAAKLFCELTGMDRVSWVNTGSEAVQAAIRIARTVTGRDKIVVFSGDYHGNFDEVLVRSVKGASGRRTTPLAPGVPSASVSNVLVLDYGETSALDAIRAQAGEIAAVLVEPVQSRRPDFQPREFLHALRALTKEMDIVLVFDEVITGFRIGPGGAQEYYGVEADLATYGKIIGGGMPIGVIAGRARFMDTFDGGQWRYGDDSMPTAGVTFFAGTFVRHPFAIAAAHASLSYLKSTGRALQDRVNAMTARLAGALNAIFEERGVKIAVPHFASQMFIRVSEESELATLFFHHLRLRGVHLLEGFPSYVTAAHSDEDIDFVIAAARDAILEMQSDGVLPMRDGVAAAEWFRTFPTTDGQRELWVGAQMGDLGNCALNESDAISIKGLLDADRFAAALTTEVDAAEAFRLRFARDGEMQTVAPTAGFTLGRRDLSAQSKEMQAEEVKALCDTEAATPFNLEKGPLIRGHLIRLSANDHLLLLYAHHIVFDGYSSDLLMKAVAARYDARPIDTEPFSVYAAKAADSNRRRAALGWWRGQFANGAPSALDLPTDRPYPPHRRFDGGTVHGSIGEQIAAQSKQAARSLGVGIFAYFLSVFATLTARLTGQEEIVIGVPAAGQAALGAEAIGYGVNMLPTPLKTSFDTSFSTLARSTQTLMVGAVEHQWLSLSELSRDLKVPRDPRRPALIQSVFNYSAYFAELEFGGCAVTAAENARRAVQHELFFNLIETADGLAIDWDYAAALFDAETIERWIGHFAALLEDAAARPDASIGELSIMSASARRSLFLAWRR